MLKSAEWYSIDGKRREFPAFFFQRYGLDPVARASQIGVTTIATDIASVRTQTPGPAEGRTNMETKITVDYLPLGGQGARASTTADGR